MNIYDIAPVSAEPQAVGGYEFPSVNAPLGVSIYDKFLLWHKHRADFLEALKESHGTHDENTVLALLAGGSYFMWGNDHAAMVGFPVQYPLIKGFNMYLVAGDLSVLLAMRPGVEAWAKTQGISRMVGGGRSGWVRVPTGYQNGGVVMFKDI